MKILALPSSNHRDRSGRSPFTIVLAMAGAAMALTLMALSLPRIVAALYAIPAVEVINQFNKTGAPQPEVANLVLAQQGLQMAQLWQKDATLAIELSRIDLILALRQLRGGLDAGPLLDETIATVRNGLHGAPAQAQGWLILSEATMARDGIAAPKLVEYLAQSMRASPYTISLSFDRAWLAMLLWDRLDGPTRDTAALQMRLVIEYFGINTLVRLAKQVGDANPARQALASDPALRRRFEALYLQL